MSIKAAAARSAPLGASAFDAARVREPGLDQNAHRGAPLDDPDTIRREMREDDHDH